MKKLLIHITFVFSFLFLHAHCFSLNIDSLWTVYNNKMQTDSARANAIHLIAREYAATKPDTAIILCEKQLPLDRKSNRTKNITYGLTTIGLCNLYKGNYPKALDYFLQSLEIAKKGRHKREEATCLTAIGSVYYNQGNLPEALKYYFSSLKMYEEIKHIDGAAFAYNNIGAAYEIQNNLPEATKNYLAAQKLFAQEKNKRGLSMIYNNLGGVYKRQGKFAESLKMMEASLKIKEEENDKFGMAVTAMNVGAAHFDLGNYPEALKMYLASLKMREETGDKEGIAICYLNLGELYVRKNDIQRAKGYFKNALAISKEIGNKNAMQGAYQRLASADSLTGDFKSAYSNYILYVLYKDSLSDEESEAKMLQTSMQYEFDKKEIALKAAQEKKNALAEEEKRIHELQLSRSKYITISLVAILLLSLATGFIFFRQNRLKSRQRTMQLEQKLLRIQMNPHFIFNSLNSIHSVVLSGDKKNAATYLASFAKLMRSILESSRFELVSLQKEVALLENYINLQILRFENEISYHITIDPELELEDTMLPPMLTQPFIENAIEHGLYNVTDNAQLLVSFKKENEFLHIEVCDNGPGLHEQNSNEKHISMATGITQERLSLLNRSMRKKTSFSINEAFPENTSRKGVKVSFFIPLQ